MDSYELQGIDEDTLESQRVNDVNARFAEFLSNLSVSSHHAYYNHEIHQAWHIDPFDHDISNWKHLEYVSPVIIQGNLYTGLIDPNSVEGLGIMIRKDGAVYEGEMKQGLPWGFGREITLKQVYKGEFVNGRKQGKGLLITKDC